MSFSSMRVQVKKYAAHQALPWLLERATEDRVGRFVHWMERLSISAHHRAQFRYLGKLVEEKHPSLQLIQRLRHLHPNVRRAFINSLLVNATLTGEIERKAFRAARGTPLPPYLIVISPTMRCNLACYGCYAGHYPRERDPLSFEVLDRIVTEGTEMGVYFFTISGGEPFLRPDLLDLYEKHPECFFQIYTNGTRIDDRAIARMQRCGNVAPAISIEGWEEQTDARRGPGAYATLMSTMDALREAGLAFGFSATATRRNVECYFDESFYDHLVAKGCLFGWFFLFVPVGQDNTTDLMITPLQRHRLRQTVSRLRFTKPLFAADFWDDGCLSGGCMSGGSLYLHVNYRGDLEPCVFMHFAEDNVLDYYRRGKHLSEVLDTPLFQRLRAINRKDPNLLRPCPLIDHNEWLEEVLKETQARPTHPGAENIVTSLAPEVRAWAEEYRRLADHVWYDTDEYAWAQKKGDPLWDSD